MIEWTESDEDYSERHFKLFCERNGIVPREAFSVSAEEIRKVYENAVNAFNRACDKLEKEEDDAEIRRVLTAALGAGTYMIEEPIR